LSLRKLVAGVKITNDISCHFNDNGSVVQPMLCSDTDETTSWRRICHHRKWRHRTQRSIASSITSRVFILVRASILALIAKRHIHIRKRHRSNLLLRERFSILENRVKPLLVWYRAQFGLR